MSTTQRQVKAKNLKEGDRLVFKASVPGLREFTIYVDDVEYTRDGQVKVNVGFGGTGTEWYEMDDIVTIDSVDY